MTDDLGRRWLFKPGSDAQILVEVAAAQIARMGVLSPLVYARRVREGGRVLAGSIQPWLGDQVARWELDRALLGLVAHQREALQRHHVIDWLLANTDAHRGQFLIRRDGSLVAVDKSQAFRFFPHDRLRWQSRIWWANWHWPVYFYLFEGVRARRFPLQPGPAIAFAV